MVDGPTTPAEVIAALPEARQASVRRLHELIRTTLPDLPVEARDGSIGYGPFHYRYASGREGEAFQVMLAANRSSISLHVLGADADGYVAERWADRVGRAKVGKSCVRFGKIEDLDLDAVTELLRANERAFAGGDGS
jgi:ankyrin repeat protein